MPDANNCNFINNLLVRLVWERCRLAAAGITAYDPEYDEGEKAVTPRPLSSENCPAGFDVSPDDLAWI